MRAPRRGLVPVAVLAALCLVQAGCHTLFPRRNASGGSEDVAQAHARVIRPGTTVTWTVEAPGQPRGGTSGRSVVGPDGRMEMGPYGTVHVGGLTLVSAQTAVEKQLRHYLREPHARLQLGGPHSPALAAPIQPVMRWSSDDEGGQLTAPVRPVSSQAPAGS